MALVICSEIAIFFRHYRQTSTYLKVVAFGYIPTKIGGL